MSDKPEPCLCTDEQRARYPVHSGGCPYAGQFFEVPGAPPAISDDHGDAMPAQDNYYGADVTRYHGSRHKTQHYGPGQRVWFLGTERVYPGTVTERLSGRGYRVKIDPDAHHRLAGKTVWTTPDGLEPYRAGERPPAHRQF